MVERLLQLDDLHLPARSTEAIYDSYLIADQDNGGLQVLLFQLHPLLCGFRFIW